MIGTPKVSVIMACHNAASFIERAITSVVNQTFANLELIIVDDASRDDGLLLAQSAARMDSRIKVCSLSENVGAGTARNIGIDKAQGEWLAILDADDIFLVDKLERQLKLLDTFGSNVVLIGSNSFEIDSEGNRFSLQTYPVSSERLKRNLIRLKRFPPHSSLVYKADAVRSLKGYNNRYSLSEDFDLWLRLTRLGSFALIPAPLVEYRHHASNISKANSGLEQVKYGLAAVACHFIRETNILDPSQYSSMDDWNAFLSWIAQRIEEEGLSEYLQTRAEWSNALATNNNSLFTAVTVTGLLLQEPAFAWRAAKTKMFGNYLPQKLADEWLEHHAAASSTTAVSQDAGADTGGLARDPRRL